MKKIIWIVGIIAFIAIFTWYYNPKYPSCENVECELVSTDLPCAGCDYSKESHVCILSDEANIIIERRNQLMKDRPVLCEPCAVGIENDLITCGCSQGKCRKGHKNKAPY